MIGEAPPRILVRVLFAVGLLPVFAGAWLAAAQHGRISTAVPIEAVVVDSREEVVRTKKSTTRYAVVTYRFDLQGREHESKTLYPSRLYSDAPHLETLARFPEGARVRAWVDPGDPSRTFLLRAYSFVPYAILLAGAPILALAAGLATGGVRFHRSGTPEVPDPEPAEDGWFEVAPFRSYLALRNAALAGAGVIALVAGPTFAHYGAVAESFHPAAALLLVATLALVLRLLWGAWVRTWAGSRLEEAKLSVRPSGPEAGAPLAVRVTQSAKSAVTIRAFDVTLIAERTEVIPRRNRTKYKTRRIVKDRARLPVSRYLIPGESHTAEHVFSVPSHATARGQILKWRVEVRTRIFGGDYRTHFPFPVQ